MAEYRVDFRFVTDSAERSIKNLKTEIKGVTKEFEQVKISGGNFIKKASNLSGLQAELKNARREVVDLDRAYQNLGRAFGGLAAAFGAGFALTKVIADVKELDTNLRRLGTVGGNVAALGKGLGALSDRLDGAANKTELAAASYQALSAGFTETGANLRVVEAATKAAVGGLADVTSVVEVTTKTLNAYNMSGDQAAKVTDSISKAIEFGQVQWSDYTSQLGRVASVAAIAGVSLDEVNAFVAAATKNGATAEVAFTGLGSTLATILKPSKESADAAEQLGINWTLAGIKGEGFASLMGKLAKAMQENPELANQMVGGQEAVRGAFAAASKGAKDYDMILKGLGGAAGKADADFQTMKGSLENTLKALDTSFKNLSEALGTAFGPTIVIAVQDITKAVNGFADFMAMVPQPVMNATGELVKLVAQMLLLQKAIQAIIALRLAFIGAMVGMTGATVASGGAATTSAGAFALYTNNTRALQAQAATATPVLNGMLGTLRNLATIGTIAIVVNAAVTGMAAVYQAQAEIDRLRGVRTKGGAAAAFGGSATAEQKKEKQAVLAAVKKERESAGFRGQQAAAAAGVGKTMARQRADQLAEREASARAILALPTRGAATPAANAMGTPVGATVGGGGGDRSRAAGSGADKAKKDAKRAAEKAAQAEQQIQDQLRGLTREIELNGQLSAIKELQFQAEMDGNKELQARLQGEERTVQILQATAQSLDGITDERLRQKTLAKAESEITSSQQETMFDMQRIEAERTKAFNEIITGLDLELALRSATTEQAREQLRLEAEMAKLRGQGFTPGEIDAIAARKTELAAPKTAQKYLGEGLEAAEKRLQELTNTGYQVVQAANAIGDAFGTAFKGLVSGSMTAQEALAGMFQSIADHFADMVAQMIAEYLKMALIKGLGALIGGIFGGGGGFAPLSNAQATSFNFNPGAMTGGTPWAFANGGIAPGGFTAFANGGMVTGPTMGLVGEGRYNEAIVPLPDGKSIPVQLAGGGSSSPTVIVNVDAKGSQVEGNEQNANQLGRVISAAVQTELIKQQRPGGLLAR